MTLTSEYNTRPRRILIANPLSNRALSQLQHADLVSENYRSVPDADKFKEQFSVMVERLRAAGIAVSDVADFLSDEERVLLVSNPNSMFTRDPLITLPWAPGLAIIANMKLAGRRNEPALIRKAASQLGITQFIDTQGEVYLEGGDVLAVVQGDRRTLYVGVGERTNIDAGLWLAEHVVRTGHADEIICFRHNRALLHLDTCFTLLPNAIAIMVRGCLPDGFLIDHKLRVRPVDPADYLRQQGYKPFYVDRDDAEDHENCNMLYLGDNRYLSFNLPARLATKIEELAGIQILQIDGSEIAKANGGVHCLTRPLY